MSKTTMFKRLGMGLALAVLSLALVACGGNDDDNKDEPAAPSVVTGGQLSTLVNEAGAGLTPKYGDADAIPVKGLADADYTAGGESDTKFAMKLFPANNNGQLDFKLEASSGSGIDDDTLALVTAKYTDGNLVISFGAGIEKAKVEDKDILLSVMPKGSEKTIFTLVFIVPSDFIAPIVTEFTVADSGDVAANATVQTIVLAAKDAADLNKGYAEGNHSFALTLTGTGASSGVKVTKTDGADGFKTEVVKIGDDYAVVFSTDQVVNPATYSIAPVAPEEVGGDPLPARFVKVKSVGPVPKVTVADVEITEKDGTANAVITFLPAALTAGTAAYDTTKFDLFAVSSDETIATVTVTNSNEEGTADAIVVEDASGKTAKATVTVYVVPVDATDATNAYSSTTFEVSVTLDPITAVDDAKIAASSGHILLLPLNKGGVALATDKDEVKVLSIKESNATGDATYTGFEASIVNDDGVGKELFKGDDTAGETATHVALTVATGANGDVAAKVGDVVTVTLQVVTPVTDGDDVVRSTDTFEVTVIAVPAVTANDVAIGLPKGAEATVTLGLTDYDAAEFDFVTAVAVTTDGGATTTADITDLKVAVDEATGVATVTADKALDAGDIYTVTLNVVADGVTTVGTTDEISSTTFKVTATEVEATAKNVAISIVKGETATSAITKVAYVPAAHDLLVAVTDAKDSSNDPIVADDYKMVPTVATDGDAVTLTVDTDTALTVGDVYTVTLYVVEEGTVADATSGVIPAAKIISTSTFTVTAADADTLLATATAADVDLAKAENSELILPVVKTAYNAAAHDLLVAVTAVTGTGAAVGDITATLDPAGDDATAVKLVVAKELVGVYTVTLDVVLDGTDVVVSTHDITVTAADESTVTAAANVANAAINKADGKTLILSLVKVGSGTTDDSTLTAEIAGGTDGDITVALLTDANIRAVATTYATATRIELVTKTDLTANTVYTVTLTIGDGAQAPATIGTPTTFTVTAVDAVTATAADVTLTALAATTTVDSAVTGVKYVAANHDLVATVITAPAGGDVADLTVEPTDLDSDAGTTTTANKVVVTVADTKTATAGVYTVRLDVVLEGTTTVISSSEFKVTAAAAADESTVTATANIANAATNIALTDKTTLILPLVKAGSGTTDASTLTAEIAVTDDQGIAAAAAAGDITVTLASTDAGAAVTSNLYKDSTHIKLVTTKALEAGDVYTVTLTVSDSEGGPDGDGKTTFEVTVIADLVSVTAADVTLTPLTTDSTATATLTKVAYNAPAHSLLVAVTGATGSEGVDIGDITVALVDNAGDDAGTDAATGVKITVGGTTLTDGDVYTVTISVVKEGDTDTVISTDTFTVTAKAATSEVSD